jgi:hypothetical protein
MNNVVKDLEDVLLSTQNISVHVYDYICMYRYILYVYLFFMRFFNKFIY